MTPSPTSTLSRFPAAAAEFVRDLYVEHLEEASFLYDQRNYMLENVEMEPHDIAWNEQRCDQHLDALVAGGDLTLAMCEERAALGEEGGELYAAMRVFCRAERPDLVKGVLDELDTDDVGMMAAARDGLKHELPWSWSAQVSQWLDQADEPRAAILAVASAYRDLNLGPALLLHASGPLTDPVPILWALGQLRERRAAGLFEKHSRDADDQVRRAAAIGALRCHGVQVAPMLRQAVARNEVWASVPLALVGELSDFEKLDRLAATAGPNVEVSLALGLLGHARGIDTLLAWLDAEEIAEEAALALRLLTGLSPPKHEPIEEDADPTETGSESTALALSQTWWKPGCVELRQDLGDSARIRFGKADSSKPARSVPVTPRLPRQLGNLLCDELMIRSGLKVPPYDGWGACLALRNPMEDSRAPGVEK